MTTARQEAFWVLRAQCDDDEAIELLLRSVQSILRRYLIRIVGLPDADDVLQDVLVIIYRKLGTLDDPQLFRPWAFRIASRAAFRQLRKRRKSIEHEHPEAIIDDIPATPELDVLVSRMDVLRWDDISPASRAVLTLHFQESMPLADVAAVLDIPLGTAKSRLAYGLAGLRKQFARKGSA